MSGFKVGCQTITWGNDQHEFFPEMLGEIREAGFEGVEIGYRRLKMAGADEMKSMLDNNELALVGTHVGGNQKDRGQAQSEWGMLNEIIDYLDVFGTKLIMFSGLKFINDEKLARRLRRFREACEHFATRGVQLAYHNHDWEFDHDGRVFDALVDDDRISFCPDLGWIHQAKEDVVGVLERIEGRIAAVHAKDIEFADSEFNAVLLGAGQAPLVEGLEWAKEHTEEEFWVIREQDSTDVSTKEIAERNAVFLKSLQ